MIKNLQKNKHNQSVIVSIEQKINYESELASLKSGFQDLFSCVDGLRRNERDLENEIYLLENSGNAYDEMTVERKRKELSELPTRLEAKEAELKATENRISFLENEIAQIITVSVADILENKKLISREFDKIESLNQILNSHSLDVQKHSVHSDSASSLIAKKSELLIDAEFDTNDSMDLEQLDAEISTAIQNDEMTNRENKRIVAEKNIHIEAIRKRIAESNAIIANLQNKHKRLLGEMYRTLIDEQYNAYLQAIEHLKTSLKISYQLAEIFQKHGVISNTKFNFTDLINTLTNLGILKGFGSIRNEISLEMPNLKDEFYQQGIFLD